MRSLTYIIICILIISISVECRSLRYFDSLDYADLSKLFEFQNTKFDRYNDDDENNNQRNRHVIVPREFEEPLTADRRFLFPTKRRNQRYRPAHAYGRKSHWDTFFGKK